MLPTPYSQDELIELLQAAFLRNGNEAVSVYELSRSLEQGGHSTLYKAKTKQLPTDLAIKLCLPEHEDEQAGHAPLPNGLSAHSAMPNWMPGTSPGMTTRDVTW